MTSPDNVAGKLPEDVDGRDRVTGTASYAVDVALKDMLIGRVLRSPYPHARIVRIDSQRAERINGVRAVISHADVPPKTFGGFNQPVLSSVVRFVGEEVAAVAADNEEICDMALSSINVEYEELPYVLDPEDAIRPEAPKIHPAGNLQLEFSKSRGSVDQAFKSSDGVFQARYTVPTQVIASIRQFACVADWNGDLLTVWDSSQGIYLRRNELAELFDVPVEKVRVISQYEGGGFGEENKYRYVYLAALLAKKARRPVKMVMPHDYTFESVPKKRHPAIFDIKIGYQNGGNITAIELKALFNKGAYLAGGPAVPIVAAQSLFNGYRVPNMSYQARAVYTNVPPSGAFRGYGAVQTNFAVQSAIDDLAESLNMDPTELQIMNVIRPDDKLEFPRRGDEPPLVIDFSKVGGSCLIEAIQKGRRAIGWDRWTRRSNRSPEGLARGLGCAILAYGFGSPQKFQAKAMLTIRASGKIDVMIGISDFGGGQRTTLSIIAAEELGAALSDVHIQVGDTKLPQAIHSIASRTTVIAGSAVQLAARDAKMKLLNYASKLIGMRPDELSTKESQIVSYSGETIMSFGEVMQEIGNEVIGNGDYVHDTATSESGFQLGACFAETVTDLLTGRTRVDKLVLIQDFGHVVNPHGAECQMQGGAIQSLGYALQEEHVMDCTTKQFITRSWLDYRVPTMMDVPEIQTIFIENPDPRFPFGAKGGGESMIVCTHSAIRNAIANATGVRFHTIPITPKMVIESLSPS